MRVLKKLLGLAVIVKAAPGAKVIPSTVVFAEIEMAVVFERANVAVSADPLGTVAGVQFVSGIPVAGAGVKLPCRAAGVAGLDAKHQN